ncbi:hypothetical protein ACHAWF_016143 [Thalassiosira exigua]
MNHEQRAQTKTKEILSMMPPPPPPTTMTSARLLPLLVLASLAVGVAPSLSSSSSPHSPSSLSLPSYEDPVALSVPSTPSLLPRAGGDSSSSHFSSHPSSSSDLRLLRRVPLIRNASLSTYDGVWIEPYAKFVSRDVDVDVDRIVLEFEGSISGIQYDRFGAVWVDGVELLRTTTPEPSGRAGEVTRWRVERDVTEYRSALVDEYEEEEDEDEEGEYVEETLGKGTPGTKNKARGKEGRTTHAAISIPNVVNDEYTGVIFANVSLAFYASGDKERAGEASGGEEELGVVAPPPVPRPATRSLVPDLADRLVRANATGTSSVLEVFATTTNALVDRALSRDDLALPSHLASSLGKIYLDVRASAHEDEEDYYTKVPTVSNETSCGAEEDAGEDAGEGGCYRGGPLRFLHVYVDGQLGGIAVPFPTVYSGGINPMLWRPLAGILSFDVPPVRFDLTPFGGAFGAVLRGDAANVTVSLEVVTGELGTGLGSREPTRAGKWYLDGALVFHPRDVAASAGGSSSSSEYGPATTTVRSPLEAEAAEGGDGRGVRARLANPYELSISASSKDGNDAINVTYAIDAEASLSPCHMKTLAEGLEFSCDTPPESEGGRDVSNGTSRQEVLTEVKRGTARLRRTSTSRYDHFADCKNAQDDATFDWDARVRWSRARSETYASFSADGAIGANVALLSASWVNSIEGSARYNRSLTNHTDVNVAEGHMNATFVASSPSTSSSDEARCFRATLEAVNGSFVGAPPRDADGTVAPFGKFEGGRGECGAALPPRVRFCGRELCGTGDLEARFWRDAARGEEGGGAGPRAEGDGGTSSHAWGVVAFVVAGALAGAAFAWRSAVRRRRSRPADADDEPLLNEYVFEAAETGGSLRFDDYSGGLDDGYYYDPLERAEFSEDRRRAVPPHCEKASMETYRIYRQESGRSSYGLGERGESLISVDLTEPLVDEGGAEGYREGPASLRSFETTSADSQSVGLSLSSYSEKIHEASCRAMERASLPQGSLDSRSSEGGEWHRRHEGEGRKEDQKKRSNKRDDIREMVRGSARRAARRTVHFTNVPEDFTSEGPVSAPDYSPGSALTAEDHTLASFKAHSIS